MVERVKLDGVVAARFFAALMIVLLHLVHIAQLQIPAYLGFIPRHFALGVPLFFVVSAFSLFVGYSQRLGSREELRVYALRRFFRIAPLFYAMMAFYIAFRAGYQGIGTSIGFIFTSATFTFNLVPQYAAGFVSASWSIGTEMVFYLILPMIVLVVTNLRRAAAFFGMTIYISAQWAMARTGFTGDAVHFGSYFIAAYMAYFGGGVFAYFLWQRVRNNSTLGLIVLLGGAALTVGLMAGLVPRGSAAFMFGLQATSLTLLVVGIAVRPIPLLVNRFTMMMGDASFGLYLIHPVVIAMLWLSGAYELIVASVPDDGLAYLISAILTVAILFPLALAAYWFIEVPGNRLGGRLIARGRPSDRSRSSDEPARAAA